MAVAATVAATFALAGPASAATLGLTPASASAFTNTTATFSLSGLVVADHYTVTLSEPATPTVPITAANPLTLAVTDSGTVGAPSTATSGNNFTSTVAVTSAGATTATFTAKSSLAGTVSIAVADSTASTNASSTLTVVAGAADANHNVSNLAATPTSLSQYFGEASPTYTVTATGTGGVLVNGATVNYEVLNSSGTLVGSVGQLTASTTEPGQYTVSPTQPAAGKYTVKFWVDNAASGSTSVLDPGDTVTTTTWNVDALPVTSGYTAQQLTITSPSAATPLQTGKAATLSYTVKATQTNGTAIALSGLMVGLDVTAGGTTTRYQGKTGTDGTVTFSNVSVTAAQAVAGSASAKAYVSESSTAGDGVTADTSAANTNYTFAAPTIEVYAPGTAQALVGGQVNIPVTVKDQFGNTAGAGDLLSFSIPSSDRNGGTSGYTGTATVAANGTATLSYKDTGSGTSTTDHVTVTDVTSGYTVSYSTGSNVIVSFLTSLTPSTVTWAATPTSDQTSSVAASAYNGSAYTVTVANSDGTALSNQAVTVTVSNGFVGASGVTASTGKATYTTTTDDTGVVDVYVGSAKAGAQTISASAGSATKAVAYTITYYAVVPYNITLAPATVKLAPSGQSNLTATVSDEFGNPQAYNCASASACLTDATTSVAPSEDVTFNASGPAAVAGGVSPRTVTVGTDGAVTIALQAGTTTGEGTVTASIPTVPTTADSDATVALASTATSKYTVGAAVSKLAVAGTTGVKAGGTEKIAVRAYNADGSVAGGVTVNVKVSGANSASGTATTGPNGELGYFSYTAKNAGTDTVTATVGTVKASTKVTIGSGRQGQQPVMSARSPKAGTVNVAVQTHPTVAHRKVKVYYVYKVKGHKATLKYAGSGMTNGKGRAHAVLSLKSGHYVLKARMAGSDYVEHLSNRYPVTVK